MKQQSIRGNESWLGKENAPFISRVPEKCRRERAQYIKREIKNLMKKQVSVFLGTKKLHKELEQHGKEGGFATIESPAKSVLGFRVKQKQHEWERLKAFKQRNQERMSKLAKKFTQKTEQLMMKSSENLMQMSRVRQQYQKNQQKQSERIQSLKKSMLSQKPRPISSSKFQTSVIDQKVYSRVQTAKNQIRRSEEQRINRFLHKMKTLEERNINKEIKLENKKALAAKSLPKCNISQRILKQQALVNQWTSEFQTRFSRFEQNRKSLESQKFETLMKRSALLSSTMDHVLSKKSQNDEQTALSRIESFKFKIKRMKNAASKNSTSLVQSKQSFVHNVVRDKEDHEKEAHSEKMRKIYNLIRKLRELGENQKLSPEETDFLIKNMDQACDQDEYKQIVSYLSNSKSTYLQLKSKEEEERIKKNKKTAKNTL